MTSSSPSKSDPGSRRILGIDFFSGGATEAVERMRRGGLLVVPAAPALTALPSDSKYREALLEADLAIADSAFMVLLWNLLEGDTLGRISGLEYFCQLVQDPDFREDGASLYVMASEDSAKKNVAWLESQGIPIRADQIYVAPMYRDRVVDPVLLQQVSALRPRHVVITVGGGIQERLGLYIKQSLDYTPAIHCIGAAIAFRSGDQVFIPAIADRLALGWLLRCLWRPRSYVPRYWSARKLAWLLLRYRRELPPLDVPEAAASQESSTSIA
jgi:UDP-N-acetyl-D-mannosaminuronic acid transferase (WecB/TagA/CpsF family)